MVQFWYVDVGLIDRTSQLQSSLFEAPLYCVLVDLLSFYNIGTTCRGASA